MLPIDTILFDLDGTLVDSNDLILETFRRTYQVHFPMKKFTHSDLIQMMGPPLSETFASMTDSSDVAKDMINTYRSIYKEIEFDYIKPYPNVIECLKTLKNAHFNIGIVTTKFKVSAIPSLKHYGLDQYIDVIIGLDDVTNHKPHPEPIKKALARFNHQGAVMIGDSPSDLLAGTNAGILSCGVDWSYRKEEIKKLNPDFWLDDFSHLYQMIVNYNKQWEEL